MAVSKRHKERFDTQREPPGETGRNSHPQALVTGMTTFIVMNEGIVYQKDLGPNSINIVKDMELYHSDPSWNRTEDEWPQDVAAATH